MRLKDLCVQTKDNSYQIPAALTDHKDKSNINVHNSGPVSPTCIFTKCLSVGYLAKTFMLVFRFSCIHRQPCYSAGCYVIVAFLQSLSLECFADLSLHITEDITLFVFSLNFCYLLLHV